MKIQFIGFKKNEDKISHDKSDGFNDEDNKKDEETKSKIDNIGRVSKEEKIKVKQEISLKNIIKNFKKTPRGAYTLLLTTSVFCVLGLSLSMRTYKKINKEDYQTYNYDSFKQVTMDDVNNIDLENTYIEDVSSIATLSENDTWEDLPQEKEKITETLNNEREGYKYEYIRPLAGETYKGYSMDKVVYSKTLDMWKVHDGVDILADIGSDVVSAEKGKVEKIYMDNFYGWSIIIDHQNGIKTIYRNLQEQITLKEGEDVVKGKVIAKVGNTASGENKDDTHLHFEVVKDGGIVSPDIIGIK